jgi:membrane protease subunit HflK
VAQAQGDAQRFRSVLAEYQKAPQVTRDRLYIESMQQVYSNVTKVMVESRQGSNLLYLPLDKIMQQSLQQGPSGAGTDVSLPSSTSPPLPSGTVSSALPGDARTRDNSRTRDRDGR